MDKSANVHKFNVLYTKHLTQKNKIWDEGIFTFDQKSAKGTLYGDRDMNDCT